MATGVQRWSKTAGTNSTADSNVNWAEGMAPSAVNDSARAEMASVAKWRDDISGTLTTGGTSTAYTLATNQLFTADAAGMSGAMLTFIPHATSGLNPTLAVDGLTARAINQSTGVAVPTGALVLGTPYVVTYIHATTEFILQGAVGAASFGDPTQIKSTDAGAGAGPTFDIFRDSVSPAANDIIGSIDFNGGDSAANKQLYARISIQIDPTSTNEFANIIVQAVQAGVLTTVLQNSGSSLLSAFKWVLSNTVAAFGLSGGNTAARSGSPTAGDTRYNTTLNGLEYWNGTVWVVLGQQPTVQKFTSGTAQTYTATAGVVRQRVRICGPGGGGGAQTANAGANGSADTSFQVNATGTAWTAVKGSGGIIGNAAGSTGGIGGTGGTDGSTGTLIYRAAGAAGGPGVGNNASVGGHGGYGGATPFGGGGQSPKTATTGGNAAANTGSGGAGGGGGNSGSGAGAGEYVEFWVTGMTTALYTVGLGGAGGPAGTVAGGNGAAGVIIIEEFYS